MPPKAAKGAAPSKKTEQKKKDKVVEDKTFGLKNKKGAKQQKFIQQVEKQVKYGQQSARKLEDLKAAGKDKKEEKKKAQAEINELFKPVITQKINKGADPKSVVCAFFKQGQCGKGDKCKFSHDLGVERKGEKRSAYVDLRENEDNMEDWDEEKLKEVVDKKHAEANNRNNTTDIICKYFLDALEKNKYGWFWECPNGERCKYRHALPPGFVLKKDKKKEEKEVEISIEDLVEKERAALGATLTKVTYESFMAWKKKKISEQKAALARENEKKKADYKAGKNIGFSGREMFTFNPELATGDQTEEGDDAFDISQLDKDDEEEAEEGADNVKVTEVNFDEIDYDAADSLTNGAAEGAEAAGGVPIDENLFAEDDEDLEELEQNLESLDLEP